VVLDLGPTLRADPIRNVFDAIGVDRLAAEAANQLVTGVE